ncbi:MAG: hypothetical protein JNM80_12950 [Phycisphaerae bacterium]|nr:hypothetical protein [Phycisphaerae bacterium]
MGRRKATNRDIVEPPATPLVPRVLIVSPDAPERERLALSLRDFHGTRCELADSVHAARSALGRDPFDLVLLRADLADGSGLALLRELADQRAGPAAMLIEDSLTLDKAVEAMRLGAVDIVNPAAPGREFQAAVRAAVGRARDRMDREARLVRLSKVCRKLNDARHEISSQVSSMCEDLVSAYQELSDQMTQLGVASEFNSLIRQELDVESLLRTALEFILAKTGPTNGAIFLPSSSRDYSLGAYVNYNTPDGTGESLLEHLAGLIPARLEDATALALVADNAQMAEFLGDDAHFLDGQALLAFPCRHDDECLAIVALFRDRKNPFPNSLVPVMATVASLFGRQLARVIHIHHRHLPKDQWGAFDGNQDDDDLDLAA